VTLVRDLLAITRVLFRSSRAGGDGADRLEELTAIGKKLNTALELAGATPGSMGHRAAWQHAEDALERLSHLIGSEERTQTLLKAVGFELEQRARSVPPTPAQGEREAKRRARRERS
jgi:hypothetical protein